ncbi:TPA: cell division protein FtsL, partial [Bacillus cereus biovar anthracis]|nr:cell division protein FtsL [Bacillus cereus biovar anthracis]
NIQNKTGESYIAYEIVRALRNHKVKKEPEEYDYPETTKIYIRQVSREGGIDQAVIELFDRGEFGYLYYLLIEGAHKKEGENLTLNEETYVIQHLQSKLSPRQLEMFAQFMSFAESRKTTLAKEILSKKKEKLKEIIEKIYLGNMPSKKDGIQCYKYPSCPFETNSNCESCIYAVPSAAVLTSIGNEINHRIDKLLKVTNTVNMQRDRSILHDLMERIREAIKDFGLDFVCNFIDLEYMKHQLNLVSERIKSIQRVEGDAL